MRKDDPYGLTSSAYAVAATRKHSPWRWSGLVVYALLMLWLRAVEPAPGVTPSCPTQSLLGIPCPGCGTLRATHALLNGHMDQAWQLNAAATVAIPLIGLLMIPWIRDPAVAFYEDHPNLIGVVAFIAAAGVIAYWATRVF